MHGTNVFLLRPVRSLITNIVNTYEPTCSCLSCSNSNAVIIVISTATFVCSKLWRISSAKWSIYISVTAVALNSVAQWHEYCQHRQHQHPRCHLRHLHTSQIALSWLVNTALCNWVIMCSHYRRTFKKFAAWHRRSWMQKTLCQYLVRFITLTSYILYLCYFHPAYYTDTFRKVHSALKEKKTRKL